MQVHVLQYLKYNIEKKTYTNHRAIFLETCLGSFQVFSYHPNGKLQPATILISESSFQPAYSNWETVAQQRHQRRQMKKKKKKTKKECGRRVSPFLGFSPLLFASFGFASFRYLKIWKMWFDSYFACVFVTFRYILFRTS